MKKKNVINNFQSQISNQLTGYHIFLDTNVFIDAYDKARNFSDLFNQLKNKNNTLLTINSVLLKFLRGSRSNQEYNKKKEFIHQIIDSVFTITKDAEDLALQLSLIYQSPGNSTSVTDFYLAAVLGKYVEDRVCVMTKNHKDFPLALLDRIEKVLIENERDIQVFAFYKFNNEKYQRLIEHII